MHPMLMMYKCVWKPWVMRVGALLLGATSFMVVWSEATIGLGRSPDVSPFSLVLTPPLLKPHTHPVFSHDVVKSKHSTSLLPCVTKPLS